MLSVDLGDQDAMIVLCGERDRNLRWMEARLGVKAHARGTVLRVSGASAEVDRVSDLLTTLRSRIARGGIIDTDVMDRLLGRVDTGAGASTSGSDDLGVRGRVVAARTANQRRYVDAMNKHDVVFGVGPAGTGKTFLAVACAVAALQRHEVRRIVLTRPAVEAGERLGFLPGDLAAKVNPYLRPLLDALDDMLGPEEVERMVERGAVEIAPLAFMRGRTLSSAWVILDEAQNCTVDQLAMLLTRLGPHSRCVVTGDLSQSDLPRNVRCGLDHAMTILRDVEGIAVTEFESRDVVRHPLVARIAAAYEADLRSRTRDAR
ncbi:MAG: PhoH family protein [Myxococcales bacterium]|nr:PhoH family protein [Myxococcales bacterium]